VPGPPIDIDVSDVTKDSAVVTWKAPESDGGSPVTGYVVERSLAARARWLRVNKQPVPDLKLKVEELVEDNEYIFRVIVENKVGPGEPSQPSKPVMARDPWRKYSHSHLTAIHNSSLHNSVAVSWSFSINEVQHDP